MQIYDIDANRLDSEPHVYAILEYNVGNFSDGEPEGYDGDDLQGFAEQWRHFFGENTADICLISESRTYIDHNKTLSSASEYGVRPLYR
jgi:hypothetical protein